MNDHEAMDAINAVLEANFRGQLSPAEAVHEIARITGANKLDHQETP